MYNICILCIHVCTVYIHVYVRKYACCCKRIHVPFYIVHVSQSLYNIIIYYIFLCIGATAYVLTESPTGVGSWLWNPHTGKHYSQHEPYTPLTSVGCAINKENVSSLEFNSSLSLSRYIFNLLTNHPPLSF